MKKENINQYFIISPSHLSKIKKIIITFLLVFLYLNKKITFQIGDIKKMKTSMFQLMRPMRTVIHTWPPSFHICIDLVNLIIIFIILDGPIGNNIGFDMIEIILST